MSEESVKVASLVEKLAGWCEQQPEYPYLFLADRARRKRAARIVAERLLLIPSIKPDPAGVDRASSAKQQADVKRVVGKMKTNIHRRITKAEAKAQKDRARYMRLSLERAHELALRFNELYDQEVERRALAIAEMERLVAEGQNYEGPEFEYEGETDAEAVRDTPAVDDAGPRADDGGAGDEHGPERGPQGDTVSPDGVSE